MAGFAKSTPLTYRITSTGKWMFRVVVVAMVVSPLAWALGMAWMPSLFLPTQARLWAIAQSSTPYQDFLQMLPAGRMLVNSAIASLLAASLSTIIAALSGYAISQLSPRQQTWWIGLTLAALVVPLAALAPGRFLVFRALGWSGSPVLLGVTSLLGGSPFFVLVAYRAFHRISADIYDSSRLDGANLLETWRYIGVPLARSSLLVILVLSFALFWGDLDTPLFYLQNDRWFTLPVGLEMLSQMKQTHWRVLMAGVSVAILPPVLLLLVTQFLFQRQHKE